MVALGTAAARCPGPAGPERPARSPCKESYVGPWLPEPLLTAPDVAEDVELADSVSVAMLVLVLETLTPIERAVFVLREGDRCEPPSLGGPRKRHRRQAPPRPYRRPI